MLLLTAICCLFRGPLIAFYKLSDSSTKAAAETYLFIVSLGFLVMGFNFVMQGLLTATGDSKTSFKYKGIGLVMNIVLDPLMIYGIGPFPKWGISGAAIATLISQAVVSLLFLRFICKDEYLFKDFNFFGKSNREEIIHMAKLGTPPAIFSIIWAFISMVTSRFVVVYGDAAIAVQRIGAQIESITWMTSDGFAYAMNSFTAQNYGARKYSRVKAVFRSGISMMSALGVVITALLVIGAAPIFSIFIREPDVIESGANYLRRVGL